MHFTSKHYFNFGKRLNAQNILISQEGWDTVRCDDSDTPFSIPADEISFRAKALKLYSNEARDIIELLSEKGLWEVFSVGCGCGYLEYQLKEMMPELKVTATDFNPKSIERLKKVFTSCDRIEPFDMMTGDYSNRDSLVYLLFRIDTEISNEEWRKVYKKMYQDNVKHVIVVATEFLTFERFAKETIKGFLKNIKGYAFCGYIRTKESFEALWGDYYQIERSMKIGKLDAYLLNINK